jgi:hypothetical protein
MSPHLIKRVFLFGAIADAIIAVEWYLISLGLVNLPVHPSFFVGESQDFRYAMSIGGLFMAGWACLLAWGSRRPVERKGLLLITAVLLFVAILSDYVLFSHLFSSRQIVLGTSVKLFLVILFSGTYFLYSRKK